MVVKKIGGNIPPLAFDKKGKIEASEGADFQKALQEAHSHLQGSLAPSVFKEDAGRAEMLGPAEVSLLPPILEAGAPNPKSQGVRATERTLDLLERYREALSDPRVSLKKVHPLVQSLRREVQEMNRWTDQLPPSDPLRKIMGEIEILSRVEIEKFNRGDYV